MAFTREDVARAQTHAWVELNSGEEQCNKCLLKLPKETPIQDVPACPGYWRKW